MLDEARPHVVTLDIALPGMDGLETLRRLRERWPGARVVMLSGHGETRNVVQAMRLGAVDFVTKPFVAHELESAIEGALGGAQEV